MEKTVVVANIESLSRQRNLFLILTILLAVTGMMLSLKLITSDQKTILVPGISQEIWTKEAGVSKGYLEETTLMYLPLLLDLNPEVISYKAGVIFKYVSQSNSLYMKKIQSYFAVAKEKYQKFALSTYFSAKNLQVDTAKLTVIANGILTSRFGEQGFEVIPASYLLSYEWLGGRLRLKEFKLLKNQQQDGDADQQEERDLFTDLPDLDNNDGDKGEYHQESNK